jgi:hypothetical protein
LSRRVKASLSMAMSAILRGRCCCCCCCYHNAIILYVVILF